MMLFYLLTQVLSFVITSQRTVNFTVIYDEEVFHDDVAYLQSLSTTTANNNNIQFVKVQNNGTLQNVILATSQVENHVVFLFANNFALLDESITKQQDTNVIKFGVSFEDMHSIVKNYPEEVCLHYNALLVKSLVSLVYSIFLKSVAIVTDDTECTLEFYKDFSSALQKSDLNNQLHLDLHHVVYDFHGNQHDHHSHFYGLKSIDIGLIILLVPHYRMNELLRAAAQFSLLANAHIWLIPNYDGEMINKNLEPAHFVTLDNSDGPEGMATFKLLRNSLPRLIKGYEKFHKGCVSSHLPEFCLKAKLYSEVVEEEYVPFKNRFSLTVKSRNSAGIGGGQWEHLQALVEGDNFYVLNSNITMLTSITDRSTYQKIRAVVINEKPYFFEDHLRYDKITGQCTTGLKCHKRSKTNGTVEEITCCVGFLVDLLHLILLDINIDIDMYFVEDDKYGALNDEGKWNGIMGDIVNGKADFGVAPMAITSERLKDVQFTSPWLTTKIGFVTQPQPRTLQFLNFEFMAPLGTYLQVALWITVTAMIFITWILDNIELLYKIIKKGNDTVNVNAEYYTLNESLSYISGVALQRDTGGENPRKGGSRFSSIIFAFGMVIIVTTYTALLVEQGVTRQQKDPFLGSKDTRFRNPTPSFLFTTLKSSSYESFFKSNTLDVFRRISNFMEKTLVNSVAEGVIAVKDRKVNAYMDEYLHLVWFASNQYPCTLGVSEDNLMNFGLAFPVRRDFPWLNVFNEAILQYRESEELQKLHSHWFKSGACDVSGPEPFIMKLGITNVGGLIFIVIVSIAFCFLLLFPEHLYWRSCRETIHSKLSKILYPEKENNKKEKDTIQYLNKDGSCRSAVVENDKNAKVMLL